jgi:tetratricopeptide (TPR) repeat protein
MKYYTSLFFALLTMPVLAQQFAQSDNSLLLDYYQTQRFDKAAEYLKKTYPEPISNIKILKALAYCTQMQGKLPEAEVYYERVYALDSSSTSVLYSLGSINMSRGNETKAEVYYKQILQHDSTNFLVYKQLAHICHDKADVICEMNNLARANKLNPVDGDVAADFSDLLINLKLYPSAEKILDTAVKADPENLVLLESLAKLLYTQKKWLEAANCCEKILTLGDQSPIVLTRLGISYFNLNNYQCALESFSQIDELNHDETICYYTAVSYKKLKDYQSAVKWLQKTIDAGISPNTSQYYNSLADTYETTKNYNRAAFAYQKSLQFKPDAMTYYSIANMYDAELKNHKLALVYYKKYLASKPDVDEKSYVVYAKSRVAVLSKNED